MSICMHPYIRACAYETLTFYGTYGITCSSTTAQEMHGTLSTEHAFGSACSRPLTLKSSPCGGVLQFPQLSQTKKSPLSGGVTFTPLLYTTTFLPQYKALFLPINEASMAIALLVPSCRSVFLFTPLDAEHAGYLSVGL
ncbi:hypothetical protein Vretifemale_13665 [Volvox reticuliferus]|uniref:Uncharacterized protein n=1 Tax=Volvox reticuliferus TaxID=1737510 RepID=A0A8J4CKM6_9CHLO|nr:hypothetical protein Vretifemale_13665 [Volvox reticuliferus]